MNKVIFKEPKRHYLCYDILLYLIITIIGFIILFSNCLTRNMLLCLYSIFYLIAIFSLVIYFLNRTKDDYEYLIFTVINVLVGTFALLNYNYYDEYIILSLSIFIYTLSNTINKGYYLIILDKNNDANVVAKSSVTFLLALLGVFVSINFCFRNLIASEFLGYYFVTFGLISLLEPFLNIILKNKYICKYLLEKNKNKKVKVIAKTKVKPIIKKKIVNKKSIKKNSVKK